MSELARFLVDLAEAEAECHTPPAAARRMAEAIGRHAPLVALVFGWRRGSEASAEVVSALAAGVGASWSIREGSRDLSEQELRSLSSGRATALKAHALDDAFSVRARQLGATRVLLLPFAYRAGSGSGYAQLYLRRPPAWLFEDLAAEGLLAALRVAHRTSTLVTRVAAVSRRAFAENQRLRGELEEAQRRSAVVARSQAMRTALDRVEAVCRFSTTVLLRGESGTGKNVLAALVHERSPSCAGPFVSVNCGALPAHLVESELFGHEKGAFTGADRRHRGAFERAGGGTIFLDEVGDLPLAAQVKILRVLQEGSFSTVGGEEPKTVEVRVVTATNRPLEEMVADGRFREDLFYRLNVFPIHLPPLRDRQEDLQALVETILEQLTSRLGLPSLRLSRAAHRKLLAHSWPGNVRELRNVLERAAILARGEVVSADVLEFDPSPRDATTDDPEVVSWDEASRRCIAAALRATRGRIYGEDGAAAALGLKPTTLQTKMRRFGISRGDFLQGQE